MADTALKIGTRGSRLAQTQARKLAGRLAALVPDIETEIVVIRTSGDWRPSDGETRLSEREGGKGLFVKEIEAALLDGRIDCAVHSMKDVPSFLPEGLAVDHVMERDDPRDALICENCATLDDLPQGAVVGTSSVRRQAIALSRRPDLQIVPFRGNVDTRLEKLRAGQVDATFLALCGLDRLGLRGEWVHPLDPAEMLPACGQGVLAVESRTADSRTRALLDQIHHPATGLVAAAERAALQTLDGSCHTPIGAFAVYNAGAEMHMKLAVYALDGGQVFELEGTQALATPPEAVDFGGALAAALRTRLPGNLLV